MEHMCNFQEIVKEINRNKEVNFLAFGMTYLHANFIDATIMKLTRQGVELNGLVLLESHDITGRILHESDFITKNERINFINYEYTDADSRSFGKRLIDTISIPIVLNKQQKTKRRIYIIKACFEAQWYSLILNSCPNIQFVFIEIDDGAGSYEKKLKHIQGLYPKNTNLAISYLKASINYWLNTITHKRLTSKSMYIVHQMFVKKGKSFQRNMDIVPFYLDVIKKQSNYFGETIQFDFNNTILINSQPLAENCITNGIVDLDLYTETINELRSNGYNVVIKPHPREVSIEKYKEDGWELLPQTVSQESLLIGCKCKPICIISIYSSTLLNAYGLFDITPISLAKILLKKEIGQTFSKQLKEFINTYEGIIQFPKNIDELINILDNQF